MLFDAHLHLGELSPQERLLPGAALSSSHSPDEVLRGEQQAAVLFSYGIHPLWLDDATRSLEELASLAASEMIAAVGECGFDFYHGRDEAELSRQKTAFREQASIAREHDLPLVVHVRRGMREIFAETDLLRAVPAVIFHCYPGTAEEGKTLLKRGINAFFSFGTPLLKEYRGSIAAFLSLPRERLLLETDAPFQPLRGREKTLPADLLSIYDRAADLLGLPREVLEEQVWLTATTIFPALRERVSANLRGFSDPSREAPS